MNSSYALVNEWTKYVRITMYDQAGNYNYTTATIVYDSINPDVALLNPSVTQTQTKLVRAVVTDTNADYIEYEKIDWATTCDSDITFTNTYTGGNDIILSDEADNGQKICFHAEDLAWNPTYVATSIVSNLDRTAPVITLAYTPIEATTSTTRTIDVTAVDSFDVGPVITMAENTSGVCNGTLTFWAYSSKTYNDPTLDNTKTNCYKSEDTAWNISYSMATITLNTIPTIASVTKWVTHIYGDNETAISITLNDVTDPDIDSITIQYSWDDSTWVDQNTEVGPLNLKDYTFNIDASARPEWANTIYARVWDGNNFSASTSVAIFKDTVVPAITVTNIGNIDPEQSKTLSFVVTDTNTFTAKYIQVIDSADCTAQTYVTSYTSWTDLTFTSESDNSTKVCLQTEDEYGNIAYGNTTTISWIDRTAPADLTTFELNSWNAYINTTNVPLTLAHPNDADVYKWCITEVTSIWDITIPSFTDLSCSLVKPTNHTLQDN
jgi:hypothetical protein